jgi:hypothetical protein
VGNRAGFYRATYRHHRRRLAAHGFVLLGLCSMPCSAFAGGVPGAVCRRDEVVRFVTDAIQGATFNAEIDHHTIAEVPTSTPDVVRCYAYVRITFYDTPRFGHVPLITYRTREYSVRKLIDGFEVAISPPQGPFP